MGARPEFDVVVVGGGAAGCVVAARVSQSASQSVCLLEAGPDLRQALPDDFRDGWHMPQGYDWGYTSEPNGAGTVEKLRRLKLLGGTSFLTRFALRGSPADYDEWRDLGNDGWGFHDVLPYFIKLEADADFGDQPWHGKDGPIPIRRYFDRQPTDIGGAGRAALEAVGFPPIEDHNRPGSVGVGRMPMSSTDGIRTSTALAYLGAEGAPRNLTIRPESHVSEVVIETNRAVGVRLLDGTEIRAGCVVLCAGTYGSPPLLMRSGVGPPDHLRAVGIEVHIPLPGVGSNLSDHPSLDIDCGYRGPCRAAPLLHSIATFHSSVADEAGPPDLMLWMQEPVEVEGVSIFEIDIVLLKPSARGSVRLRSRDPADPPRIELPIVDRIDIARLVEGYGRALEVAQRPEIRRLCEEAPPIPTPGDLPRLVGASAYSVPHVVGTCAMGSSPDDGAVVDASGRVHGTEHLFVVDASIMPTVPSGFTHIPTIMIAERLSEQISASLA